MFDLRAIALAAAASLALAAPASAANLLVNGDFETGDLAPWLGVGQVGVNAESDYTACCGFVTSHPDNHVASFGSGGKGPAESLSQSFNSILGQLYTLSFDLGAVGSSNTNTTVVTVGVASQTYTLSGIPNFDSAFNHYSLDFVGVGAPTAVTFSVSSFFNDDVDTVLDNVSVAAAVPEPATWALMIGGFGLAGAALRRRRVAQVRI
jgi:hypothetical protein